MSARRKQKRSRPSPRPKPAFRPSQLGRRGSLLVRELAEVGESPAAPAERLTRAIAALFAAFEDPALSELFLEGWSRARRSKALRLELAWIREQLRLSVEELLRAGMGDGAFRSDLDPEAMASVILGTAEGLLLQSVNQGGPVPAERLTDALLRGVLPHPVDATPGQAARGFGSTR